MQDTNTVPPFAPVMEAERDAARQLLSQAERKATGHLYRDCPAHDLTPLKKEGGKVAACKPCLARWQDVGALARTHQKAFDAAWYAAAAATPLRVTDEDGASQVIPPVVRAAVEPCTNGGLAQRTGQAHRPNKFGGKCGACNGWVEAGAGWLTGKPGSWGVAHANWEDGGCPAATAPSTPAAERAARPGMYWDAAGLPVRVQLSRTTGNPYAQRPNADGSGLTYLGGGRHLEGLRPMTLDEAKAWGRKTSACCVCGTVLENPDSVAAGIGPICASKGF